MALHSCVHYIWYNSIQQKNALVACCLLGSILAISLSFLQHANYSLTAALRTTFACFELKALQAYCLKQKQM